MFRYFDEAPAEEVDGSYPFSVNDFDSGVLNDYYIYRLGARRSQYVVSLDIGGSGFVCGYGSTDSGTYRYDRLEIAISTNRKEDNKEVEEAIKAVTANPGFVSLLESIRVE